MKKRIIALLLSLSVCVGLLSVVAFGADIEYVGTIVITKNAPYCVKVDGQDNTNACIGLGERF